MAQLVMEMPDPLLQQLERLAADEHKGVQELVLEQMSSYVDSQSSVQRRLEWLFQESGLFHKRGTPDSGPELSEEELDALAAKAGRGKPLSEMIIEDRGPR